jgi:two-component system, sensor histidine kinase YesM
MKKKLKKPFRIHSIKERILITQIIFTMVPFIIAAVFITSYLNRDIKSRYMDTLSSELDMCADSINRELSLYIHKSIPLPHNSYVVSGIQGAVAGDMSRIIELQSTMFSLTTELETTSHEVRAFTFYMEGYKEVMGSYIAPLETLLYKDSVKRILEAEIEDIIWEPNIRTDNHNKKFIVFYRNVSNPFNNRGVLQVSIPYDNINKYITNINIEEKAGIVLHTNRFGRTIQEISYPSKGRGADRNNKSSGHLWISSKSLIDGSELKAGIPLNVIRREYIRPYVMMLVITIAFCIIVIGVSNSTSKRITRGLTDFINHIKNNEDLLLNDQQIDIGEDDEVYFIKQKFVKLLGRMNEVYKSLIEAENQNSMLEIQLLQARINPHLLYNSLTVIKLDAMRRKDSKTLAIVDSMTNYYRAALNNGEDIIKVSNELSMLKEYVNIVNFTYLHGHKLHIEIDEDIKCKYMLKHLLQPIVENSVLHGLNANGIDGEITVKGSLEGDNLVLRVIDNGCGMEEDKIEELMKCSYISRRGSYGIKNTIKRIKLFYGETCGLTIESELGKGTTVTVIIRAEGEKRI